jgi:uncharacterized repeat protein (TIGR03803 family)
MLTVTSLSAQTLSSLFSFNDLNGAIPAGGLVRGLEGGLYGTTSQGGAYANAGTIFRVTESGEFRTLYNFCPQTGCPDGRFPTGELIQTTDGDLYGVTREGGSSNVGAIFKLTPKGAFTVLHSFSVADGSEPSAGLTRDSGGNFYGVAAFGGVTNNGTLFKVSPDGSFNLLHSFSGQDGSNPSGALVQAANGDLFGTTYEGGSRNAGTIFKISQEGIFTSIHNFCSQGACADGLGPLAGLIAGADGDLYGTTYGGGAGGLGTIFKITPTGTLTTLYQFDGTNGFNPQSALTFASDGNFYGVTPYGGSNGAGTIFKISPEGNLTTLASFCGNGPNCSGGVNPSFPLVQNTNGTFYGVTASGGPENPYGMIFTFSDNLSPFVETVPAIGEPGTPVRVFGAGLARATRVSFDGALARFAVVSSSEILTFVPMGAKSGTVQVVTPAGTLSANVEFRVR